MNKSIEDLLLNLDSMGVEISIYSPKFLSGNEWHVGLKRRTANIQVEITASDPSLYEAIHQGYDEWMEATNKLVSVALDPVPPPTPPKSAPTADELNAELRMHMNKNLDDEIPF